MSQWLSLILGNNKGRARDRNSDLRFSTSTVPTELWASTLYYNQLNLLLESSFDIPKVDWQSIFKLLNPLLYRYSFWRINNRQLLKTLWEKEKLLITINFSFSHNVFNSIRYLYHHLSILLISYLYVPLNWKSPNLAYQVKGLKDKDHSRSIVEDPGSIFRFKTMRLSWHSGPLKAGCPVELYLDF